MNRFVQPTYDLLIIGGGINGAAIANLAAGAGLKVALIEKKDFASGTSSKSTKLMHGGIRYLENLEFDLVREALKERYIHTQSVPHLVKPIPFIIPVYKNDPRPLWLMRAGVMLYDMLCGKYRLGPHRFLSVEELLKEEPNLNRNNLTGGVLYYDAQMDDARLCLENILSADKKGASVANYVEATGFIKENGKAVGVKAKDVLSSQTFEVRSKRIVCAVGPWTQELWLKDNPHSVNKIRATKGVHLVYRGQFARHALLLQAGSDRRIFFVIPWMGQTLIGTTDTDYTASADQVNVEEPDIKYLLEQTRRSFPHVSLDREHILASFAGLRPLVYAPGVSAKVSRRHLIQKTYSNIYYVMGGKYTTYRRIAMDFLNQILKVKIPEMVEYPLYGSGTITENLHETSRRYDIDPEIVDYLRGKYGARYTDVLNLTQKDPDLKTRICTCSNVIKAQVLYSIETEMAKTAGDIIERRLGLEFVECSSNQCRRVIEGFIKNQKSEFGREA